MSSVLPKKTFRLEDAAQANLTAHHQRLYPHSSENAALNGLLSSFPGVISSKDSEIAELRAQLSETYAAHLRMSQKLQVAETRLSEIQNALRLVGGLLLPPPHYDE